MNLPQTTSDDGSVDAPARPTLGRHVADDLSSLSIRSFVGGRYPRHRAYDGDQWFAEIPELTILEIR